MMFIFIVYEAGTCLGLDQELTLTALRRAYGHGCPEIHHSDQRVQYAATSYVTRWKSLNLVFSFSAIALLSRTSSQAPGDF